MAELPRQSPGTIGIEESHSATVYCPSCGDPVGHYPETIAVLLTEEESVALQLLADHADEPTTGPARVAGKKLRIAQLAAFARWHG